MLSPGRKGQGSRGHAGGEVLVFPVWPPARHSALLAICNLAVNCSAIAFSSLSVSPLRLPRTFPSFLLCGLLSS